MRDRASRSAREHIAQLAARLMAQDHIDDFGAAKRKAVRQLGLPEGKNLPSNQEVELALRDYRQLYQPEHGNVLHRLRLHAAKLLERFDRFSPYLTGSVLSGLAGPHSDINLLIYTDDAKAVEVFCINQGLVYKMDPQRGGADFPTLRFEDDGITVRLSIRPENEARVHGTERVRLARLRELIQSEHALVP